MRSIDTLTNCVIAIHGGCGVRSIDRYGASHWERVNQSLHDALQCGWRLILEGASAVDAVQACVQSLEDCPLFNAGRGAALNSEGIHELDAAIMCGKSSAAGAISAARHIRNPIAAARKLLDCGFAVMLTGSAADEFARSTGLDIVEQSYYTTERRKVALSAAKKQPETNNRSSGTVGAVARDNGGHLAAATSTGGATNKPAGRVGDSPIIGAGTYAKDGVCALSCTGTGEIFMTQVVAHDIASRVLYLGESLDVAASVVVFDKLARFKAKAGLIGIDASGNGCMLFNTPGMHRGWIDSDGKISTATHPEVTVL